MVKTFAAYLIVALSVATAAPLEKRDNTCKFPSNKGMVPITPHSSNGGWAMSSNQQCKANNYCPYACPPGKLMAQWDPSSKSYTKGKSMEGGLKCNSDGTVLKPFQNKDYCVDGKGTVKAHNKDGNNVAFCQTVLPGNEAMLIPTNVDGNSEQTLAVPGSDYWASTAAHYYINPPGVSTDDGCVWGSKDKPHGNWAPYVAGTNMNNQGNTFVKIGYNPIYTRDYQNKKPDFGIKITCDEGKCNNANCEIDPSKSGFNEVNGSQTGKTEGAAYCVVTAEDKSHARIEIFSTKGNNQ